MVLTAVAHQVRHRRDAQPREPIRCIRQVLDHAEPTLPALGRDLERDPQRRSIISVGVDEVAPRAARRLQSVPRWSRRRGGRRHGVDLRARPLPYDPVAVDDLVGSGVELEREVGELRLGRGPDIGNGPIVAGQFGLSDDQPVVGLEERRCRSSWPGRLSKQYRSRPARRPRSHPCRGERSPWSAKRRLRRSTPRRLQRLGRCSVNRDRWCRCRDGRSRFRTIGRSLGHGHHTRHDERRTGCSDHPTLSRTARSPLPACMR